MSNPSGRDQDASQQAEDTPAEESPEETPAEESPDQPAESPTEVITTGEPEPQFESAEPTVVLEGAADDAAPHVRYSAPSGFDVKSTEVIQTPPEPATEIMSVPGSTSPAPAHAAAAAMGGQPRPVAPQAIPPRPATGRHRSWGLVLALILVIAALAAVAVFGTVWLTHSSAPKVSQEDQVRQTIHDFDNAIQKGDLAQLRGITCGTTRDSYVSYDDKEWAATHDKVIAAKRYPMVASIDEVAVNGQHAEANVTTFIAYEPQVRSTRSFDLQFIDGRWKICEGPIG
jgi:flagellar basal body-associated protein FliL